MKYKFHELEPSYEIASDGRKWPEETCNNTWKLFRKEIHWLAKRHNCNVNEIRIDPYHPTGEVCIFIRDVWFGYIDSEFYKMVDGIPSSWD